MLHVFFGSDRGLVRDAATAYIDSVLPADGTLTTFDARDYQSGQLTDALGVASLFGGVEWFVLDTPSDSAEFTEEVQTHIQEMADSANVFIVLEGQLLAAAKKKYQKHAEGFEEFTAAKGDRFNTFAIADAFAKRDKRRLWVLVQEAKLGGVREEEIIGILWWQLKALRLAAVTGSAEEAGMKSFPYSKAKQALRSFSSDDITTLSQSLLDIYHKGHTGIVDLDLALEAWTLS